MSFKDSVIADNLNIFLSDSEFADKRTVKYDGNTYTDVPIILSGIKEQDRRTGQSDHSQGLYRITSVLHMRKSDLGNTLPEQGSKISINNREGGGGFFREYYIASSVCEMGMLRVELEAVDE